MKVLLLHPQLKKYEQPRLPPLGILSIAAVLEKEGHKVFVLDLNVQPNDLGKFLRKEPDLVGITATTPLIKEAWRLAKICKRRKLSVIIGGPHVSALPEESLKKGIVDLVVRYEGEGTMKEICVKWPKYKNILGISYLKNGRVIHNPRRPLIQNLDSLPFPAYHLLSDISRYSTPQPVLTKQRKTLTLISSRGCPYHCNYCYKGVFGDRWRAHSPEYILDLWEYLVKEFGVEEIGVEDDTFNLDLQRVERICNGLIKRKIKTSWTTAQGLRADRISKSLLRKMKKTGFYRTGFGIEAGSQEMVIKIGKNLNLDKASKAIAACKELGIESIGYFMIGNIGENEKTMQETIDFAIKLDPDIAHFTIANPLPGTPLFEQVKKEGKLLITDWNLYGYTRGRCFFEHGEVKKDLVERMWRKAYRQFYLRPAVIKRFLTRKETWFNLPKMAQASLSYLGIRKET